MVVSLRTQPGLLSPTGTHHKRGSFPRRYPLIPLTLPQSGPMTIFCLAIFAFLIISTRRSDFVAFSPLPPSEPVTGGGSKSHHVNGGSGPFQIQPSKSDSVGYLKDTSNTEAETVIIAPGTLSIVHATASSTTSADKGKSSSLSWVTPKIPENVDWSRFAMVQYATNMDYLCNSLMIFDELRNVNTKADLVLFYPEHYAPVDISNPWTKAEKLIMTARDTYGVKLHPIKVNTRTVSDITWADSYTKLLAFNLTNYDRVLSIDSDGIVLQNMDEIFFSPPAVVAAPQAYWLLPSQDMLSSQVLLVTPSTTEFARVSSAIDASTEYEYDMEIINQLYRDTALLLPHRPYDMLTAEFRRKTLAESEKYLGEGEAWNPVAAYNEAKFMHFSDWPVPKPWKKPSKMELEKNAPKCVQGALELDCSGRNLWVSLYRDFMVNRSRVCMIPLSTW